MKAEIPRLRRLAIFECAALMLLTATAAQTPERFEVTVIRQVNVAGADSGIQLPQGGTVRITNEPVQTLIRMAFRIQDVQIADAPRWVATDRYNIEAKTGRSERIRPDRLSPLIQNLLVDRFNLRSHWETRTLGVLALRIDRANPGLRAKAAGDGIEMISTAGPRSSRLSATATSMEQLADYIGNQLGRVVVDRTGLVGQYNFSLEWRRDEVTDESVPVLPTALREQLGLRVQSERAPVRVFVIDSISRPSEN